MMRRMGVSGTVQIASPYGAVAGWRRAILALRRSAFIALYGVALAVVGLLLAATLPAFAGFHTTIVTGSSMGGALPVGSMAVTRSVSAESVRVGDVIAFRRSESGMMTLHRVISIQEAGGERIATTRGDANATDDVEPLVLNHSGERVVYHVPVAGYLVAVAQSPLGRLVMGGIAAIALAQAAFTRKGSRATGPDAATA